MRLLLDSHTLLWALGETNRLKPQARAKIGLGENEVFVSSATVWELSIKQAKGKLEVSANLLDEIDAAGFLPLHVTHQHGVAAATLAPHHGDPFDRMLIAQAQIEGLTIVTRDPIFATYGARTMEA